MSAYRHWPELQYRRIMKSFSLNSHCFLAPWCFTHQYKNTTQFCFYAGLAATQNTKTQGLPLKMVVGSCNVDCKTYDSFLKAYVGGATIDTLSNFVNGCIVVPIQARTQYYEPGVVSITVNSDNWIRVQCDTETVAEVRCLLISQSS